MARISLPMLTSKFMVAVFLVTSIFVAVVLNMGSVLQESGTTSAAVEAAPVQDDSMILLQGMVKVDKDIDTDIKSDGPPVLKDTQSDRLVTNEKALETLVEDTEAPVQTTPESKLSHVALIARQARAKAVRLLHHLGVTTHEKAAGTGMVIVFVVLLLIVVLCLSSFLFSSIARQRSGGGAGKNAEDIAAAIQQRERMLAHASPVVASRINVRAVSGSSLPAHEAFHRNDQLYPPSGPLLAQDTRHMNPPSNITSNTSLVSQVVDHRQMVKPPPLCPTLVMPMSEALLGIQMYELAQLSHEGALNIVGMSGKPLLRAQVKKVGSVRALEIAMPEANSIPRASIGPPTSGELQQRLGSRALEIRGMRGAFYGILEMRSSGACYVVKEGQTVLSIDGDADTLALSLKNSVGVQLASVRCSTEQFEGVDHVEIRVEPGVDTVLVVAVVLAVLLLSPYLPPASDVAHL